MSKRILTMEEQEILRNNTRILSCSERSITFTPAFKREAVRQHKEGMSPQSIFVTAGFPLSLIGRETPKRLIRMWLAKSDDELAIDGRGKHGKGGRKRKERVDLDSMTLEEQNAYLRAENDFLAQLRGIPRTSFRYRPGSDTK